MAANIFGERFLGVRTPAWHGLGKVFDSPPTAREAFEEAGLLYRLSKAPLFAYVVGEYKRVPDEWVLVREPVQDDPEHRLFGIVGKQYQFLDNEELIPTIERFAQAWPIETVGALDGGRTIFVTLDAGRDQVAGDELSKFFLLTDTKDARGRAMRLAFTPIRVVCQNTLTTALSSREGTGQFSIVHNSNVSWNLSIATEIIAASKLTAERVLSIFRRMAKAKVEEEALSRILSAAYPLPVPGRWEEHIGALDLPHVSDTVKKHITAQVELHEADIRSKLALQGAARELYERFCDEHMELAQTPWAMYNAIVELEDYRSGRNASESLLIGRRAFRKQRAFTAAAAMVS